MSNVIIFGAAGAVASAAALEAKKRGAKVWLSVRQSELQPLNQISELASAKGYRRVVADLTNPSTVTQAVKTSGATTAFLYTVFACQDGMRAVFNALKDAGVTFVVLLSSYAVKDPPSSMQKTKGSAWHHAQAEIALQSVGLDAAVLRPMYFCSNLFLVAHGAKHGVVELFRPETVFDFIVPGDIGAVAGGLLATRNHKGVIILNGAELMTMRDAIHVVAQATNRTVEIREIYEETFRRNMKHLPEVDLQSLAANHIEYSTKPKEELFPKHSEAVENLQRFGGRVTKLADWTGGGELMSMIHSTYEP
ncbi:uncharacterized protein N0V89_012595 [Didymosphaeria variabile]|uniref:NAD(P)-binding domain-containing protein n=1 Tax=Didymosphaeria variabile TaxID=1932322 RepID=A0A9W9C5K5_9PLEO|nr:uncharacterized protein N0V89_012595 [Didymosphaeria variabile]KAJ4344851.1 hypothetical protein N0V89_012595 [Didymosphaeria variabile]